jgi:hypothetical protein
MVTNVIDKGPARWRKGERCSFGFTFVAFRKCDDSSALPYYKEEHFELVGVVTFRCLNQVGRKCEDSAVFWNRYGVTSKFVCDVLPWNQEHICEIAPEALANSFSRHSVIWRQHESCQSQEQMIKEAPEALATFEMRSYLVYPISIKPRSQDHIREIAPEALAKYVARHTVIWRHDKSCPNREHVDQTTPEPLEKLQVPQVLTKNKARVPVNSSTNPAKCCSITPEAMPDFCPLTKFRQLPIPNILKILRNGSAKADNIK